MQTFFPKGAQQSNMKDLCFLQKIKQGEEAPQLKEDQ